MNEPKSIFLSTTFWGLVLTALGPFLGSMGVSLNDAETTKIVEAAVTLSGVALGVWGRFRASKPVALTGGPK